MKASTHVEQVGGQHYQGPYQHWDLMVEHNVSYLEAVASKYPLRWREKGGIEDLQKTISYLKKRLAFMDVKPIEDSEFPVCGNNYRYRNFTIPALKLDRFLDQVNVAREEAWIIKLILQWENKNDLKLAIQLLDSLILTYTNTTAP